MAQCGCPSGLMQNQTERFARMVCLDLPESEELTRRLKAGLSAQVAVDVCIVDNIKHLWSLGIRTLGCCCGHNQLEPFVNVDDRDIDRMLAMGYVQNHPDKNRKDTFSLKLPLKKQVGMAEDKDNYKAWEELRNHAQSCVNWNDGIIDKASFIEHGMNEFNVHIIEPRLTEITPIKIVNTLVPSTHWVSVKDRLPEVNEYVLVCNVNNEMKSIIMAYLMDDDGKEAASKMYYNEFSGTYFDSEAHFKPTNSYTHWMPLPEPPKI